MNNPVDFRDIQASRCDVRANENARWHFLKLKESTGSFGLFLFAVEFKDRQVNIIQQLAMVLDRSTRTHKDDDFLLKIPF